MIWRLTVGVLFVLFGVQEFLHAGPEATEIIRHPSELLEKVLAGDGIVGPWLLAAFGLLMMVRAFSVGRDR